MKRDHTGQPILQKDESTLTRDGTCQATLGQDVDSEKDLHTSEDEDGTYELAMGEDMYGPESDLHTGLDGKDCRKHPGHKEFIPIKEFTIDHLPEDCEDREKWFDYLKSAADLVVHIDVSNVSTERPKGFPLYKDRGNIAPRYGSGFVTRAVRCGQRGQGVRVPADGIEKVLEKYRLTELGNENSDSDDDDDDDVFRGGNGPGSNLHSTTEHTLSIVEWLIHKWIYYNLLSGSCFRHEVRDNFSTDLIREIHTCRKAKSVTGNCEGFLTTLNDYRKAKGLSVSEFCLALWHGTGDLGSLLSEQFQSEKLLSFLEQPCPCSECHQSGNPKKTWWMVEVQTAAHVVFDLQEAVGARVSLFYDDRNAQRVIMRGVGDSRKNSKPSKKARGDINSFLCSLHDDDVGQRLKAQIDHVMSGWWNLPWSKIAIVISHPHGSSKHITLGKRCDSDDWKKLEYNTPTCPGSSGGFVLGQTKPFLLLPAAHSKAIGAGLNQSGGRNLFPRFHYQL